MRRGKLMDGQAVWPRWLLCGLLFIFWVAGGGSRLELPGQLLVRLASWGALIAMILANPQSLQGWRRPPILFVLLAAGLVSIQLIPLPPTVWTNLPGREIFSIHYSWFDSSSVWRPISLSPARTLNALESLVVPFSVLVVARAIPVGQFRQVALCVAVLVVASVFLASFQASGGAFDNPFINETAGLTSGNFANRNHFALWLAMGLAIVPAVTLDLGKGLPVVVAAFAAIVVMVLLLLTVGSRAGLVLGLVGLATGAYLARRRWRENLSALPGYGKLAVAVVTVVVFVGIVVAGSMLGRATSIDRALGPSGAPELRIFALPTVIAMAKANFPTGIGFGAFDPVYRIWEPDNLLSPLYFNHAHNDWLEIFLEGGLAGGALAVLVMAWFVRRAWRAWSEPTGAHSLYARLGSVMIALTVMASFADYPARTPFVMAMIALASIWLDAPSRRPRSS